MHAALDENEAELGVLDTGREARSDATAENITIGERRNEGKKRKNDGLQKTASARRIEISC